MGSRILNLDQPVNLNAPVNWGLKEWHKVEPARAGWNSKTFRSLMRDNTNMTLQGATLPSWRGSRGHPASRGCLDFNQSNSCTVTSAILDDLDTTAGFTISFDSYLRTKSTNDTLINKGGPLIGGGWLVDVISGSQSRMQLLFDGTGADPQITSATGAIVLNTWQHWLFTGGDVYSVAMKYYLNGILGTPNSTTTAGTHKGDAGIAYVIGAANGGASGVDGLLDNIRIYAGRPIFNDREAYEEYKESTLGWPTGQNWITPKVWTFGGAAAAGATATPVFYHQRQQQGMAA